MQLDRLPLKAHPELTGLFHMLRLGNRLHWIKVLAESRGLPIWIFDLDPNLLLHVQLDGTWTLDEKGEIHWKNLDRQRHLFEKSNPTKYGPGEKDEASKNSDPRSPSQMPMSKLASPSSMHGSKIGALANPRTALAPMPSKLASPSSLRGSKSGALEPNKEGNDVDLRAALTPMPSKLASPSSMHGSKSGALESYKEGNADLRAALTPMPSKQAPPQSEASESNICAIQNGQQEATDMGLVPIKSLESQRPLSAEDAEDQHYATDLPARATESVRDGTDTSTMNLDPETSVANQPGNGDKDEEIVDKGPPLKDDPAYTKYLLMLKMGLPVGAVKNAMQRDGADPLVLDFDLEKSVDYQVAMVSRKSKKKPPAKEPKVRRKKIHWNTIEESNSDTKSLWSMTKGSCDFDTLKVDQSEFLTLFTNNPNPADKKNATKEKSKKPKERKSVQVIDAKRGMNGGIVLARVKPDFSVLAEMVTRM